MASSLAVLCGCARYYEGRVAAQRGCVRQVSRSLGYHMAVYV